MRGGWQRDSWKILPCQSQEMPFVFTVQQVRRDPRSQRWRPSEMSQEGNGAIYRFPSWGDRVTAGWVQGLLGRGFGEGHESTTHYK